MDSTEFVAWQVQPTQALAVLIMACVAAGVSLEMSRRAGHETSWFHRMWAVGGALALGSGIWSVHFIALMGPQLPIAIGYGGGLSLAAWVVAVCTSLLAQWIAFRPSSSRVLRLGAAVILSVGLLSSEVLLFTDMHMAPPLVWDPAGMAAALLFVAITTAVALELQTWGATPAHRRTARIAAAVVMGAGLAGGQHATALAAQLDIEAVSLQHLNGLTGNSLALLATVGTGTLLTVLGMLAMVERHMSEALHRAISTLEASALTDALTGLPNRLACEQKLDCTAQLADRSGDTMALLYITFDDFKAVNDSFGRQQGDALLQSTAQRLKALAGRTQFLARVGGDDFALLTPSDADATVAIAMARRIILTLGEGCDIEGRNLSPSYSIGVVMYPTHGAHSTMLTHGEAATRAAKRLGGGAPVLFEPQMLGDTRAQLDLLRDLRGALGAGQMELYYQPKIHAPSGAITGAEALLRWNHPTRGMVSPGIFIPIAERHGLIAALGDWVIDEACRQARAWRDEGLRMRVAINLSVNQLYQADLGHRIEHVLQKYQINPKLLTCEITESLAMEESSATARFFEEMARIGVHLSIDDFGTGYSSLASLRKLPAEELKIDRSFVLDLETSADARAVVDAVVKLAQALGLKVVAEGVETEKQSQILRSLGCDELQGYLFAKPMSAKALGLWAMTNDGPTPLKFRDSLFQATLPAQLH